jgi:hypothetical protein
MPYMIDFELERWGILLGGDREFPEDPTFHNWFEPYPLIDASLTFRWDRGEEGKPPKVFWHNLLRDFVCDRETFRVLEDVVGQDLRVIGHGRLRKQELVAVQVVGLLDVVDEGRSIPSKYSWAKVSFPHIGHETDDLTDRRMFRVPTKGLVLSYFVGESVRRALDDAGVTGWRYEPAWVDE